MKAKLKYVIPILVVVAIGGASGYYYLSKSNASPSLVFVSGTEYQQGTQGQIIVKVQNAFGNPIDASGCNVTIYYPDKTVFVDSQSMTQGGAPGSWYYTFTTPYDQIGVYEAYVTCDVPMPYGTVRLASSKAFHVGQALSLINETASAQVHIIS